MKSRLDVVAIDIETPFNDLIERVLKSGFLEYLFEKI